MADLGYVSIVSANGIYVLKSHVQLDIIGTDVAIVGHRIGNLYKCELNKVSCALNGDETEGNENKEVA